MPPDAAQSSEDDSVPLSCAGDDEVSRFDHLAGAREARFDERIPP